jgi:hypothetical protein
MGLRFYGILPSIRRKHPKSAHAGFLQEAPTFVLIIGDKSLLEGWVGLREVQAYGTQP